jgi:hypothetical protein
MTEFSIRLTNRPGQLAALARALADAGVEIEALAAVADNGDSYVRVIVNAAPLTRRVLMAADLEFDEREVLDTFLPRGTRALAHMASELAAASVNINSMYLLHSDAEGAHFAVTVDDHEAAERALTA